MLELAHAYGGDLLDLKKIRKIAEKGSTDRLRKGHAVQYKSHPMFRGQIFFNHRVYGNQKTDNFT
jgi:hypothetical protein